MEYYDEVCIIEDPDDDAVQVIRGKKKLKILKIRNVINVRMQRCLDNNIVVHGNKSPM